MSSETVDAPVGAFRHIVDPAIAAQYRADGWWGDQTLSDRLEALAAERPDALAYIDEASRVPWSRADEHAWELAAVLADTGLRPGERVGIVLPDGAAVHIAFLAAERAGLTIVGIGARAGRHEIEHLLHRTGAAALVSLQLHQGRPAVDFVAELRARGLPLRHHIVIDALGRPEPASFQLDGEKVPPRSGRDRNELRARRMGPDDLFLINSTSGTTGLPKCVVHTQNRWMYFHQKAVAFGELHDEVVMSLVPAPFGFGLWTAHFTPMLLGAPVVLTSRFDAEHALELIERERVTMLCCVSTQFVLMSKSPRFATTDFSSLRVMFTGGEAVPLHRAEEWERVTGSLVLQFFGSNETGLLSGTRTTDPQDRRLTTCGQIVPEMQVRLFDDLGRDVGVGESGQPGCFGPATSMGYLDDLGANSELFTPDGWMLMGDIARIDDDGVLTLVGRKSDIVIRGGKNISAAEVEEHVGAHPDVTLCAVVAVPDPDFGERVGVFVEVQGRHELSVEELRSFLATRGVSKELAPEHVFVLDELPRSSGGKVAKGELRAEVERRFAGRERVVVTSSPSSSNGSTLSEGGTAQ